MQGKYFPKRSQVAKQRLGCLERGEVCSTEAAERGSNWLVVLVAQSCPTLCNPMDYSPPGSFVLEILQGRILERIAIFFSRGSFWPRDGIPVSCIAGRFFTVWATGKPNWLNAVDFFSSMWSTQHGDRSSSYLCVLVTQSYPTLCNPMDCTACQTPLSMEFSRQ